ncbi:MAG TPA: MFS transporter, partial [Candidatus Limnocylindrales bacterium]
MTHTTATDTQPARMAGLFAPGLRGMTLGLLSTITLVALESLAIGTVMPIVADELGDLELYGWVYTAFFLGNLLGVVLAGGALDRLPLHRPFTAGLVLFGAGLLIGGLAPSMQVLVLARFIQGLGGGAVGPTAYVAIGRILPEKLQPRMFAALSTAWVVPGIIGPSIAAVVGEVASWRFVFLGLLPLLAIAGGLAVTALRRVDAPMPDAEHEAAHATLRRLPDALLAAGGAGLLVAGLTAQTLPLLVAGVVVGGAMLIPAYRRLTPRGTLVLA